MVIKISIETHKIDEILNVLFKKLERIEIVDGVIIRPEPGILGFPVSINPIDEAIYLIKKIEMLKRLRNELI